VTTPTFLSTFGLGSLRDLPEIEALQDVGLLDTATLTNDAHQLTRVPDVDDQGDALELAS